MRRSAVALFLALVFTLLAAPFVPEAQTQLARVGLLGPDEEPRFSEIASNLKRGLREQGYRDDAFEVLEGRVQRGDAADARATVQGFVGQNARVIFAIGSVLARVAREAAPRIPIVFITPGDPVAGGLVASLVRPGRNMTGMTFEYPELAGKRLELLTEIVPRARRVLVLYDSRDASPRQGAAAAREAAPRLGLILVERQVRNEAEVADALTWLDQVDALLGIPGGAPSGHYAVMIRAANAKRRPTIFHTRTESTQDALITYGANDGDITRDAARLVDKVLKGASAGDIPVERPTRIALIINLGIAKALGLTIPPSVLARADKLMQ
jgi:putative ABC transport system substrate-binding protein